MGKRLRKLRSLLGKIGNQRGRMNEQRFSKAISDFPDKPSWWLSFRLATFEEDQKGIDVVVTTDVGKLFLQIKSSLRGKKKFENKQRRFPIAVVVIYDKEANETIYQKAVEAIGLIREQILKDRNS